jgi:F-type H+-transporting ATPase subunit delta
MRAATMARRYAKALIEIGVEAGAVEGFGTGVKDALSAFESNPALAGVLLNPMYGIEERKTLLERVSDAIKAPVQVRRLLHIMAESRRLKLLGAVVAAYSRLEDELALRVRATVESPLDPDPAILEEIRARLMAVTGKDVALTHVKNPDTIGGLVIRMDNTILDGSLKTQLGRMKEKISGGMP